MISLTNHSARASAWIGANGSGQKPTSLKNSSPVKYPDGGIVAIGAAGPRSAINQGIPFSIPGPRRHRRSRETRPSRSPSPLHRLCAEAGAWRMGRFCPPPPPRETQPWKKNFYGPYSQTLFFLCFQHEFDLGRRRYAWRAQSSRGHAAWRRPERPQWEQSVQTLFRADSARAWRCPKLLNQRARHPLLDERPIHF